MRDEDKTKHQLITELRELRLKLRAQEASARSDREDAAREQGEMTAAFDRSQQDLADSRDETAAGKLDLAESREETAAAHKEIKTFRQALHDSEANLAAAHERYNILGDLIPFGIWTADAQGGITFLSDAFLEMSGISPRKIKELDWIDQLARPAVKNALSDWSSSLHQRDIWEGEYTSVSNNGRQYDILIRGVPILDTEGNTISWLGINLDISKRRRAEQELRRHREELEELVQERSAELARSEKLYRSIAANLPQGAVFIVDRELRYLLADGQALHEAGFKPADLEGKTIFEALPAELVESYEPNYRRALAGESVFTEHEAHDRYFITRIVPLQDAAGKVDFVLAVSHDISARRETEQALHEARQESEAASHAKSAFLANMSHEIRTPMNGIMGMISLARLKSRDSATRYYLDLADKSAMHLLDIINDVLDISKIEADRIKLEQEPFSLREELETTLEPFALAARGKNLDFEWSVAEDIPVRLVGDAGRLRQVLINLLNNALKFTNEGQISVRAEMAARQPEQGILLAFHVLDTGIGIPAYKLERIFDSFEQAHTSAHAEYGGTGLGLAICKRLVELMGGDIQVESREREGAAFTFTVLLETARDDEADLPGMEERESRVRPMRILVAEDNRVNQIYIQDLLESSGHEVTMAANGEEALEQLAQHAFDVVLMDIRMPVMGGDEATRIIRGNPPEGVDRYIPVVALTAYALQEEIDIYMQAGFNAYLTKPLELESLNQVLREV